MRPLKLGLLSFAQHVFARNGIYYYRADIPSDLQQHFHSSEIKQSLKTRSSKIAKVLAVSMEYKLQQTFCLIRTGMLPDDLIQGMVAELYPRCESDSSFDPASALKHDPLEIVTC